MLQYNNFKRMMAHVSTFSDKDFKPLCLAARANASNNPNFNQAMNSPDTDGFCNTMDLEIGTLHNMISWIIIERNPCMNILGSTWAFKAKRFPNGIINKLKAQLCIQGDQQIDSIDVFDTYAPVVSLSTFCLLLVLLLHLGWETAQIDYTAPFINASFEEEIYVKMPQGYCKEGQVLKLNRSLYELKQSLQNFFKHLLAKLSKVGMEASEHNPCLFFTDKLIYLVYVDDCLFFAPKQKDINDPLNKI
eukprot:1889292-Ditylum_brightwellii.AAC.1